MFCKVASLVELETESETMLPLNFNSLEKRHPFNFNFLPVYSKQTIKSARTCLNTLAENKNVTSLVVLETESDKRLPLNFNFFQTI